MKESWIGISRLKPFHTEPLLLEFLLTFLQPVKLLRQYFDLIIVLLPLFLHVFKLIVYGFYLLHPTVKFFLAPLFKSPTTLIDLSVPYIHPPHTMRTVPAGLHNLLTILLINPKWFQSEKLLWFLPTIKVPIHDKWTVVRSANRTMNNCCMGPPFLPTSIHHPTVQPFLDQAIVWVTPLSKSKTTKLQVQNLHITKGTRSQRYSFQSPP